MERSLLYVSRAALSVERSAVEIENIAEVSRARNARLGVTGGLICTADYFAQLIEGSASAVDELMERIDRDPRHTDVTVVRFDAIYRRRMDHWTMAYSGTSSYVAARIAPLLGSEIEGDPHKIDRLMSLIVEFATA
jgi:hypothetical protein